MKIDGWLKENHKEIYDEYLSSLDTNRERAIQLILQIDSDRLEKYKDFWEIIRKKDYYKIPCQHIYHYIYNEISQKNINNTYKDRILFGVEVIESYQKVPYGTIFSINKNSKDNIFLKKSANGFDSTFLTQSFRPILNFKEVMFYES